MSTELAKKLHPQLRQFFNGESVSIPAIMLPYDTSQWQYAREGFAYVDIGDGWTEDADDDFIIHLVALINQYSGTLVYNMNGNAWLIEVKPELMQRVNDAYLEMCTELFGV
jgi:hypothetical protein